MNPLHTIKSPECIVPSQGSEEQTVVYVVGKAGRQHWQHVYTAVTRGRCRVYVIAEESQLRSSILNSSMPRNTRLKHFLQNKLSTSSASPADFASPSKSSGDGSKSSGDSGGPSTQLSTSPLPAGTAEVVTNNVPRNQASAVAFGGDWKLPPPDEADTDEDPSKSRGPKRTCGLDDSESPNKILMVGVVVPCAQVLLRYC